MKQRVFFIIALFLMFLSAQVFAAGNAEAGKTKAVACGGCHGMDGNSMVETFPKLAGQGERYIARQINDFKANKSRKDATMLAMVAAVSDQDAADIGAYYQSQTLKSSATHDTKKLVLGQEIYKGGKLTEGVAACQGCHGPTGAGNAPAGYPQLGGQYVAYTLKQLKAFKNGSRSNDEQKIMRDIVAELSNAELEAVANYIASLK